jgi:hypothetical protein
MKVLKYIPLLLLTSCTSTRVTDQSKHYNNYQSYSVRNNEAPKSNQKDTDDILYRQSSDEDYVNDFKSNQNKRENRTYHVQNYYENSSRTPDFTQILPNENRITADAQVLPPNVFFRRGEFNPFKHF